MMGRREDGDERADAVRLRERGGANERGRFVNERVGVIDMARVLVGVVGCTTRERGTQT